jgi:hypothetical protein
MTWMRWWKTLASLDVEDVVRADHVGQKVVQGGRELLEASAIHAATETIEGCLGGERDPEGYGHRVSVAA